MSIIRSKFKAAFYHSLVSAILALSAGVFFFVFMYQGELSEIVGGKNIYYILLLVEVVLGPCLSLVIFHPSKTRRHLLGDYSVVAIIQLSALFYGLYTAYMASPKYIVFVVDRFEIAAKGDFSDTEHQQVVDFAIPLYGANLVTVELPKDAEESNEILFSEIGGRGIHMMPKYYNKYDGEQALAASVALTELLKQPNLPPSVEKNIQAVLEQCANCRALPVMGRTEVWTAIIGPDNGLPVGFLEFDPF